MRRIKKFISAMCILLCMIFTTLTVFAAENPPNTATETLPSYTVTVISKGDRGLALSECTFRLNGSTDNQESIDMNQTSDSAGLAVFKNVPSGDYSISMTGQTEGYKNNTEVQSVHVDDNKTVTFTSEAYKYGSVYVEYRNQDTNEEIAQKQTFVEHAVVGTEYSIPIVEIAGHIFHHSQPELSSTVEEGNKTVTLYYKAATGSVRVRHELQDGTIIQDWQYLLQDKAAGTSFIATPLDDPRYTFVSASASMTGVCEAGQTKDIVLTYTKAQGSVIAVFTDANGNTVRDEMPIADKKDVGTEYHFTPPEIENYTFDRYASDSLPADGTVSNTTQYIRCIYKPIPTHGSVRVLRQTLDGTVIRDWEYIKKDVKIGEPYSVSTDEKIIGYKYVSPSLKSAPLTGTVNDENVDITLMYTPVKATLKVECRSTEGFILRTSTTVMSEVGIYTPYEITPEEINGYKFLKVADNSPAIKGTLDDISTKVTLLYEKEEAKTTVAPTQTPQEQKGDPVVETFDHMLRVLIFVIIAIIVVLVFAMGVMIYMNWKKHNKEIK